MSTQIRGTHARVRVLALATVALAAASSTGCGDDETATTASAEEAPHFSYSGAEGPAKWGNLDESYALCAEGDEQSPIDLSAAEKGSPTPVSFDYLEAEVELENNGHSVEAVPEPGSTVEIDGTVLELDNFHFHASSEHVVDGKSYPLEFHFVNQAEDGSLAVFGVFVEEGRANPAFENLTEEVPSEEGGVEQVSGTVNLEDLLPDDPEQADRWSYAGSLTTPPCSEDVDWFVFADPIEMSAAQIAAFTDAYADNNRPVQHLEGRAVIVGG